jgi:ribosomal protein L36
LAFWDNLSFPSSGFKNLKEGLLPQYGVDMGRMWVVKSLSRVVSASRVDACVWEGEEYGSHCSFGKRHYVIEEITTSVTTRHRRASVIARHGRASVIARNGRASVIARHGRASVIARHRRALTLFKIFSSSMFKSAAPPKKP